ncbi:hypothetical protein CCR75_004906 [Bremia lactucae]|uniref:Uncharacterized protein n=1 Tax=Bremia lactucae TaxID=4779 RepID=A0A976FGT0_BRELC|nr:hypothetical protein CCR75_004906 [Bremia lactucae]
MSPGAALHHTYRKVTRWALAIVFGSPPEMRGAELRNATESAESPSPESLTRRYSSWHSNSGGDRSKTRAERIPLKDEKASYLVASRLDVADLDHGLVVEAHPVVHGFRWDVPLTTLNCHVLRHVKRHLTSKPKENLGRG